MIQYDGTQIKAAMKPYDKAKCVIGLYRDYIIEKWRYGDIIAWPNGELVDESDLAFQIAKWEIIVD